MSKVLKTSGDRAYEVFNNILLALVLCIVLYPLIYIVSCSFSSPADVVSGRVWLFPVSPSLDGYKAVFDYKPIWTGYANTIFYTFFGTIINVIMTVLAAYPLSRKDLYGKNVFMLLFAVTMIFNAGLIPTYMLIQNLHMINTRWVMLIPNALAIWNVIITRTYYQHNISDELLEAAQLDGCNDFKFILYIVLPLSGSITAVNTLFYAVSHWNSFFNAFIYLNNKDLFPLQIILRNILTANNIDAAMLTSLDEEERAAREALKELLKYSLIIVASVPVLCMYPFIQRHFVKGVMIGALKG